MALDELLRKQREGEDISQNDIAKSSIELINQLVDTVSSINSTVDSFSEQLNQLGSFLSSKPRLSSVGGKLQNLPDLAPGDGLDVVSEFFLLYQQALFWETVTHIQEQKLQRVSN